MTISNTIVRAVAFGSCFVRRLILSTIDILQQLPNVYDYSIAQSTSGPDTVYLHSYVVLPVNEIVPSKAYYIECKYNVLSGCRPVLLIDTYPI